MDRCSAQVPWGAIFPTAKRTFAVGSDERAFGTLVAAGDVDGQLGETGGGKRAVEIDLDRIIQVAGFAGRGAVVGAIEKGWHVGPALAVNLIENAFRRHVRMFVVFQGVLAAGDWGPINLTDHVDVCTAVDGRRAGRVFQSFVFGFGADLTRDCIPIILLQRLAGHISA